MTLCWYEPVARGRERGCCSARGEGLTGCSDDVCCQERGCCVYVARREGLTGCWCMLPGERD